MVDNKLSWVKVVPAWKEGGRLVHRDDGIGIGYIWHERLIKWRAGIHQNIKSVAPTLTLLAHTSMIDHSQWRPKLDILAAFALVGDSTEFDGLRIGRKVWVGGWLSNLPDLLFYKWTMVNFWNTEKVNFTVFDQAHTKIYVLNLLVRTTNYLDDQPLNNLHHHRLERTHLQ